MKQELQILQWSSLLPSRPFSLSFRKTKCSSLIPASPATAFETSANGGGGELSARERRQLRQERRESRAGESNWREEVEDRLLVKPKKQYKSWTEKLNLDNLALLGPQWWVARVSRVNGHETAEILARALVRNFPHMEFKVYFPAVREKRKLKNGSYSTKMKPLFPGCVFLNCVLNKEIHDFIRECDGIGGFLGSLVGNTKRQINRPKPVPVHEMEAIFHQAKEEQESFDQAFEKQQELDVKSYVDAPNNQKNTTDTKSKKKQSRKGSKLSTSISSAKENYVTLTPGSCVRVLSGPFAEFTGRLKELNHKKGKATVGFMLFGKESFVDLEVGQIIAEGT